MKEKDFWDKMTAVSGIVAGLIVAIVGGTFTFIYEDKQSKRENLIKIEQTRLESNRLKVMEMQSISQFVPLIASEDELVQELALITLSGIVDPKIANQIAQLRKTKGSRKAASVIMASAKPIGQVEVPQAIAALPGEKLKENIGWAYLGDYASDKKSWNTKYFDFEVNTTPDFLKGTNQTVWERTGALNVRANMPSPGGKFYSVVDVLKPKSQVKVLEVKEWQASGYMWAKISYAKKQ